MNREEIVAEIESKLPSLQTEFLSIVEKEREDYLKHIIPRIFDGGVYDSKRSPMNFGFESYAEFKLKKQPSARFMKSLVREYHKDTMYMAAFGHFVIGTSSSTPQIWRKKELWWKWNIDTWDSLFMYYQVDRSLETQYYMLVKIKNRWHQITFSSHNQPTIKTRSIAKDHFDS